MKRIAVIDKERCRSTECGFRCYKMCPVAMSGKEIITLDSRKKAEIEEVLCTGCGVCPKICPYHAIRIINLPDILNKVALHQYGPNGFRIFDLPVVEEKTIIGILGKNGTGKSTIIKVLSDRIHANFEEYGLDKEESCKRLLERYKGSTLHNHFTSLFKKELEIAYKPQHILGLKQLHKETPARALLMKVELDEERVHEMARWLHIDHILERPMGVLSGGELQRVALCATLLKDASLYIFDEISNFLDIYERISSAKVIKEILEGKSSIVIEHDLIVLDYIADTLHLIFGEVGAYGYLSKKKSTRIGINQFLDGMATEENMRFRDKPIIFDKEGFTVKRFVTKKLTWDEEKVKRGDFVVDVHKGALYDGEVMGVIGKNALGKSTFLDHIFHQHQDEVAFKPQMITGDERQVISLFAPLIHYNDPFFRVQVLDPLRIHELIEKQLDELSGGELQRVMIAYTLLSEKQILLLDEPTAFLDIEEKINVAKIIKNVIETLHKSALIIDHDLIFMDYLADRFIVFQGNPGIHGKCLEPLGTKEGMNVFLRELDITFRRDEHNKRPRVNKFGSQRDKEQKKQGEYYYT